MTINQEYKNIVGTSKKRKIIHKYPKAYLPQPVSEDYFRGWIFRYFLKLKANQDSLILEVSKQEYEKIINFRQYTITEGMYSALFLRWKITGNVAEIQAANTKTAMKKEQNMRGISIKVGNRLQFMQK